MSAWRTLPPWRFAAARGALVLVLGAALLLWPTLSLDTVLFGAGLFALVYGLVALASAPGERGAARAAAVVEGGAAVALGGLALLRPDLARPAAAGVVAGWAILVGSIQVGAAVVRRHAIPDEWLQTVAGLAMLGFGALLALRPLLAGPALALSVAATVLTLGLLLAATVAEARRGREPTAAER